MRADRLLSLLMLLQTKQQITAAEAAAELEVSVRTARRDLEALMVSGVPIYSQPGRGGGWRLLGGAKTDLTGLSSDEATAVFLAMGPVLQNDPTLRSAMLKLLSALPEPFRDEARAATEAIKVDSTGWGYLKPREDPRFLAPVTEAVVSARQADLRYRNRQDSVSARRIHPLGLVTKRSVWYLVADTSKGLRTFRVDRIESLVVLDLPAQRPEGFDLTAEWDRIVASYGDRDLAVTITAEVDAEILQPLRWNFGHGLTIIDEAEGAANVSIEAKSAQSLSARLAMFGRRVRLLEAPQEVLDEFRRIATELRDIYLEPPMRSRT